LTKYHYYILSNTQKSANIVIKKKEQALKTMRALSLEKIPF